MKRVNTLLMWIGEMSINIPDKKRTADWQRKLDMTVVVLGGPTFILLILWSLVMMFRN